MFVSFCRNFLQLYPVLTEESLQDVFGQTEMDNESNSAPSPSAFGAMASFLVPKLTVGLSSNSTHDRSSVSLDQSKALRRERHAVRPPVQHNWSLPGHNDDAKKPQIFQHELLQNFSINMFCKVWLDLVLNSYCVISYFDFFSVIVIFLFLCNYYLVECTNSSPFMVESFLS